MSSPKTGAKAARATAVGVTALLLFGSLAAPVSALSLGAASSARPNVIVGFSGPVDALVVALLGGAVTDVDEGLGLVGVKASDPSSFILAVLLQPGVAFAETNDRTRAAGTGWDATGWDGTSWDGTGWDGTGWDGTGWDGTSWDGTGWDGTGWDGTSWDGTGWDGTGWDGTGWDGTGWDGTSWDGVGWDGTSWDGTGWDGTSWDGSLWNPAFLASRATASSGDPLARYQWGWHTVNAAEATAAAGGPGADVCVVDSGVDYLHPDLASRMWRDPRSGAFGHDFVNRDADPMDDAGHGTHVAGVAAAATGNGRGVAGAGAGHVMAAKVLGADGTGLELDLARGIHWCVENGARVVSISLGTDKESPSVRRAVQEAAARGAILVAAAGNTGADGAWRWPAAYGEVIAVGATMPDGRWAPYSTSAGYVDLAAPGYAIVSAYRGGGYAAVNGTSFAAPFVSAAAALLLKAHPGFDAADVKAVLGASAMDLGPPGPDEYVGFGFLRADKAVDLAGRR